MGLRERRVYYICLFLENTAREYLARSPGRLLPMKDRAQRCTSYGWAPTQAAVFVSLDVHAQIEYTHGRASYSQRRVSSRV